MMKLIDLLVQELPKRGGWPHKAVKAVKFPDERYVIFFMSNGYPHQSYPAVTVECLSESGTEEVTRAFYEQTLAASQQQAWNGEGLPPVGCEFEYGTHRSIAKCIAVSHHHVFASKGDPDDENSDYEEFLIDIGHSSFYPLSTKADRKRDEAIAAMRNFATNYNNTAVIHAIEKVYESIAAGKIPGITTVPTVSQIVRCTEKCSREDAERIVAMLKGES